MTKQYEHKQIGYFVNIAIPAAMLFIAIFMAVNGCNCIVLLSIIALGICLILFYKLTVEIDECYLKIRFGIGIIRKNFSLKDIESCQVVRNPWYYGWGIHWTSNGWLYNVSGFYAVELRMKNGKKCRIGTDEPKELEKAILQSIERMGNDRV